jgi:hypothetical protein
MALAANQSLDSDLVYTDLLLSDQFVTVDSLEVTAIFR